MSSAVLVALTVGHAPDLDAFLRRAADRGAASEGWSADEARDLADVRRTLKGDGDAFRGIMQRHQTRIAGMMWRFSRDPDTHAELVGDVFIEAFDSLGTFRAKAPFEHWLSRIATRVGYRHWKRQRREQRIETTPLEDWHEALEQPEASLEPERAAALLHEMIAKLPPRDRLVITLRYLDDRNVQETAKLTGWSATMVKVQALRARRKLKTLFDEAMREEVQ